MKRTCVECGSEFVGRADKKFCDDSCRNSWHNRVNRRNDKIVRRVNRILRSNHRVLHELNPDDKTKVRGNKLRKLGFDFDYFTSTYKTRAGTTYYFCYEKGYLPLDDDWYALVTNADLH